jgi:tRNA A-37 threonylcarbamoyl transferase component Bud32
MGSAHPNRDDLQKGFLESYESTMKQLLHGNNESQILRRGLQVNSILVRLEAVRQRGRKRSMVG